MGAKNEDETTLWLLPPPCSCLAPVPKVVAVLLSPTSPGCWKAPGSGPESPGPDSSYRENLHRRTCGS